MNKSDFRFESYQSGLMTIWDDFVRSSRNATFLFERGFMEYHADQFDDNSLLVYRKDRLIAVIPAHRKDNVFLSHGGLTYGGFALSPSLHGNETLEMFEAFREWLPDNGFREMIYRPVPHIYHRCPTEDELYALHRIGAKLIARTLSSALMPSLSLSYNSLRKRGIKKALQSGVSYSESTRWSDLWTLLSDNLMQRYQTNPVHCLSEIRALNERFPQNIRLHCAEQKGEIVAGVVVFDTDSCAHAQYIVVSEDGRSIGALDFLFNHLIREVYLTKQWFDFGISTEQAGSVLNSNLLLQKEGFGAHGIIYDSYKLEI